MYMYMYKQQVKFESAQTLSLSQSYPASIAPKAETNHSVELKPRIATEWNASSSNYK